MTIATLLPPYPSKNAQKTLSRSELSSLKQKIALALARVLDLPQQKRDDRSCREFVASYAQDVAFQTLEALIWGKGDDLDPAKWSGDEKLIRWRSLSLAETLAATKTTNSPSLDLQALLDLSIVFYPAHLSRIRSLFLTAFTTTPSLKLAVEMEAVPAFTQLFSPYGDAVNAGLYGLRKAAESLKSLIVASPPVFTRLFALNEKFVIALADVYGHGLSSLAASYGFTGSGDDPNIQDQRIFVETKVALIDSFHAIVKYGMVDALESGESDRATPQILEVLLALANHPSTSSQLPLHASGTGRVPFLNRSLLEDYHDAYDFTKTLTALLRKREGNDARIERFEAHLRSIPEVGDNNNNPGALEILLHPSDAPLPRVDRKGKGRADPDRVETPPAVDPPDDLDMKVAQVLDILPDTPSEYIRALLQHPDHPFKGDPERVVGALLEGTAPPMGDLIHTAAEPPPRPLEPTQERFAYTQGRRNVFDDQEMDLAHVHVGKKRSAIASDSLKGDYSRNAQR